MWATANIPLGNTAKMQGYINSITPENIDQNMCSFANVIKYTLWALKYHTLAIQNGKTANDIIEAGAKRIANTLEGVEFHLSLKDKQYRRRDYADKWIKFINQRAAGARSKAEDFVNHWMTEMEKKLATNPRLRQGPSATLFTNLKGLQQQIIGTWTPRTIVWM